MRPAAPMPNGPYVYSAYNKVGAQLRFNVAQGPLQLMIGRLQNAAYVKQGITAIRDCALACKRPDLTPKLSAALQQIKAARRHFNDTAPAQLAADAIDKLNKAKQGRSRRLVLELLYKIMVYMVYTFQG